LKELAPEDRGKNLHVNEELLLEGLEMRAIKGNTSTSKNTMQMGMVAKGLTPGVKYQRKARGHRMFGS
jgi:hypothetical protein